MSGTARRSFGDAASVRPGVTGRVLTFYFGRPGADGALAARDVWFQSSPAFDRRIRRRFFRDYTGAAAGRLDRLMATGRGALALVVLLDQFPRNMFRGRRRAFATDAKARAVAGHAIARGFDAGMHDVERIFLYLPFEHSENLSDQDRSVDLISGLGNARWTDYAERHRAIIARFGRFPHRNGTLGRPSTAAELEFLKEPGSSF